MGRLSTLEQQCRAYGVLAVYLFGSRVADGMRALAGEALDPAGSDLDVGVVFLGRDADVAALPSLQVAIDGERVFAADVDQADLYELVVMRKAAELLPLQRAIERDRFGVSTS